jgi:hypothetical protein
MDIVEICWWLTIGIQCSSNVARFECNSLAA